MSKKLQKVIKFLKENNYQVGEFETTNNTKWKLFIFH
jgi:ribose 5-phosphate isomerase RpiB